MIPCLARLPDGRETKVVVPDVVHDCAFDGWGATI
jgi:hypothetical protein